MESGLRWGGVGWGARGGWGAGGCGCTIRRGAMSVEWNCLNGLITQGRVIQVTAVAYAENTARDSTSS